MTEDRKETALKQVKTVFTGDENLPTHYVNSVNIRVLYPWLRVEIPESKIEIVGGLPPRLLPPVGMKPLDLEIDGHLRPLATAKGDGLTKLAPQLPIGSLQEGGSADPFSRDRLKRIVDQGLLKVAFERRHGFGSSLSPLLSPCC